MATLNSTQDKVEASELLFRSMTENSADIIIRQDAESNIIYITPSVFGTTGFAPEELLGRQLFDLLCEDDLPAVKTVYMELLQSQSKPVRNEFRLKHKDGKLLWMESSMVNMLDVPGVTSVIVNLRDVTLRKEAEAKMYASEVKFRSLIENTHDGITLMRPDGIMSYLSNAVTRIMGFTPEELVGTDPRLLSHPDDLAHVAVVLEDLYPRFGETATTEYRLKHKNGQWIWLKSNITNMLHDEHVKAFVFNYEDITERKKTEELIRRRERMMADAEKMAHFGSFELDVFDEGFGELRWSEEVFRIFGYEPWSIEVTVEMFYGAVHPDDLEMVKNAAVFSTDGYGHYSIDHRVIRPDGAVRWVRENARLIPAPAAKQLYKVFGTVQDITEKKEAEDKLLKSEANLTAIFNNTEIGYIMLDGALHVVTCNPQAARLMLAAYQRPIETGTPFIDHIPGMAEKSRLKASLKKILEGGNITFDHNPAPPGNTEIWYGVRMNPIVGSNNEVHGVCISIADVTQRKQHEIEREKITTNLTQRNKDLEQFTYVISHNLRAPLTNIMGLSQLLADDRHSEAQLELYNKQLAVSVQKMDIIIKDLNYILQIKKELSEVKEFVHFAGLVTDIRLSIENIIQQELVTISTNFTEVPGILTVKSYLYSIFYNLIINSIKYRRQGIPPIIEIRSRLLPKKIELIFKDNGLGIDLKRKGNDMFGLFKRFHYHIEGKGMGLFMTKTQVQTLGGEISVESELNKGTTFTVSFPLG